MYPQYWNGDDVVVRPAEGQPVRLRASRNEEIVEEPLTRGSGRWRGRDEVEHIEDDGPKRRAAREEDELRRKKGECRTRHVAVYMKPGEARDIGENSEDEVASARYTSARPR